MDQLTAFFEIFIKLFLYISREELFLKLHTLKAIVFKTKKSAFLFDRIKLIPRKRVRKNKRVHKKKVDQYFILAQFLTIIEIFWRYLESQKI